MYILLEILRFPARRILLARLWRDSGEVPLNLIKRRLLSLRTNDIGKKEQEKEKECDGHRCLLLKRNETKQSETLELGWH